MLRSTEVEQSIETCEARHADHFYSVKGPFICFYLTLLVLQYDYCTWVHCDVDAKTIYCAALQGTYRKREYLLKLGHPV